MCAYDTADLLNIGALLNGKEIVTKNVHFLRSGHIPHFTCGVHIVI